MYIISKSTLTQGGTVIDPVWMPFWPHSSLCQLSLFPFSAVSILIYIRFVQGQVTPPTDASLINSLIRVIKSEVGGTAYGIVLLLFLVTNISWTQNLLFDFVKGTGSGWLPIITTFFAIIPFLLPLSYRKNEIIPSTERKLLITSLSIPGNFGSKDYDSSKIESLNNHNGWLKSWNPIRKYLKHYINIDTVYIVRSQEAKEFLNSLSETTPVKPIVFLLQKSEFANRNLKIEFIDDAPDANDFTAIYEKLKKGIDLKIEEINYIDGEVLFGLTGGTTPQTLALAFIALKGKRGCVYNRQDKFEEEDTSKALIELPVDIYSIRELWQEITHLSTPQLS